MKASIRIEDGVAQLILLAGSDWEERALDMFNDACEHGVSMDAQMKQWSNDRVIRLNLTSNPKLAPAAAIDGGSGVPPATEVMGANQ